MKKQSKATPKLAALNARWKEFYDETSDNDLLADADFESLCVGWCLAKGLTVEESYDFYQTQISLGYF